MQLRRCVAQQRHQLFRLWGGLSNPVVPVEMCPLTHWTPALLPNRGYLDVEGCFPRVCILDTGAVTAMISKRFAIAVGVDLTQLDPGMPFLTAGGELERSIGVTQPLTFTLNHGKTNEAKCMIPAAVIDTDAYCVLLSMHFIAGVGGVVDTWGENFHYRYQDAGEKSSWQRSLPLATPQPLLWWPTLSSQGW